MNGKLTPSVEGEQLPDQIASAQIRLSDRLSTLDLDSLNISEHTRTYLGNRIAGLRGWLELYGSLLCLSLNDSPISLEDFVLADYGAGSGLISLLAAEMGIGTVIYEDINEVSCRDAKHLSNALGLRLDHIVCGDIDDFVSYIQDNSISINAITSYDVLEHIYDVEYHFSRLGCLPSDGLRLVYASGANIENPRYVRKVKRMQIEYEYKNREKTWWDDESDSLRSYLDRRRDMISSYAPDLSFELVEQLALSTRGLIQRDIEKCIDEFRRKGSISYHIDHPTNTCDPDTGNWCEHLMNLKWLEQVVRNQNFSVEILTGCYSMGGSLPKNIVKALINVLIRLLGRRGMLLSPYYIVYARRA